MYEIGWNFPGNDNGSINGINDSGIETFKGSLHKSLAKEVCQNSLDACRDSTKPVIVEFSKFKIKTSYIPDYSKLKDAFEKCEEYWKENEKAKKFFNKGLRVLNSKNVSILRISDFNTVGLDGSDKERNSNWCDLVKGNGVSNKGGSSGGSFGIGKSAPFACSDLRTIFYSTLDKDGKEATQGVSKLASFNDNTKTTIGTGYYGIKERNTPLMELFNIDSNYSRNESGTDIYILGFSEENDWKEKIVAAVLDGFLVSIWKNLLEIRIEEITINKENLHCIFENYDDILDANIKNYYSVLTNNDSIKKEWDFNGLGQAVLYILKKDNYCRKVYISRKNGMKIFEQNRLSPSYLQFAGVLILEGDNLNEFFRKMESPQHDKWEPDRVDSSERNIAKKYKTEMFRKLKSIINELQPETENEELEIEGLGSYLADDIVSDDSSAKKESIEDNINETSITKLEFKNVRSNNFGTDNEDGDDDILDSTGSEDQDGGDGIVSGNGGPNDTSGGGKRGKVSEDEDGTNIMEKAIAVRPVMTRIFCSNKNSNEYKLIFELDKEIKKGYLKMFILGEQNNQEDAQIIYASDVRKNITLKVNKNKIYIGHTDKNSKNTIIFKLGYDDYCTLGVGIYGFEK